MARESREVWAKRVQRLYESELTDVEFAAEVGVNVHTLRGWKHKLRATTEPGHEATRLKRSTPPPKSSRPTTAPSFVEMTVAPAAEIELRVGDVAVRVPVGFDEATLSRVVSVLRRSA